MKEKTRTIGYICPQCRQPVIVERTVFSLCASKSEVVCPCGKSILTIQPEETEFRLSVPCAFCKEEHTAVVPERAFLYQKAISMSCPASGLDCCYVGEEGPVYAATARLEQALDRVDENAEERGTFLNPIVMEEELSEIKDIAARGGISCACGSKSWAFQLNYSSVDLMCTQCGAQVRIPAATDDDIEDICCKTNIVIRGKAKQ